MAVTIVDIARASGKSYPTVSRALNDHPSISAETKRKIKLLAQKMGYRPSFAGKTLKRGCTQLISLLVPDLSDPFYGEFARYLKNLALQDGYTVVIYDYTMQIDQEYHLLQEMLSGCCDGVVAFITSFHHTRQIVSQMWDMHIPLVAIGTPFDDAIQYDYINVDYQKALWSIFARLHQRGKRHLAFIQEKISKDVLSDVESHILERARNPYLEFDVKHDLFYSSGGIDSQAEEGYSITRKILCENSDIDVIMCWHSIQIYGVQRALQQAGKRIPQDVALISGDSTWVAKYAPFPIYYINQHLSDMAENAWKMIYGRLHGKEWISAQRIYIKAESNFLFDDNISIV